MCGNGCARISRARREAEKKRQAPGLPLPTCRWMSHAPGVRAAESRQNDETLQEAWPTSAAAVPPA